jgi:hypothetical protein
LVVVVVVVVVVQVQNFSRKTFWDLLLKEKCLLP